eukprot:2489558-Lingulodinium_polyedra.AAC.1
MHGRNNGVSGVRTIVTQDHQMAPRLGPTPLQLMIEEANYHTTVHSNPKEVPMAHATSRNSHQP